MKKIISIFIVCFIAMFLAGTDVFAEKKQKKVEEVTFLTYLHCENCKKKVQENIAFEKGVKSLEVSLEDQTIKIGYDPQKTDADKLAKAIEKLGYEARLWDGKETVPVHCHEDDHEDGHEHNHK